MKTRYRELRHYLQTPGRGPQRAEDRQTGPHPDPDEPRHPECIPDRNSKFDGNSDRTRIRGFQSRYGDFKTDSGLEVLYKKMTSTTFLADLPFRYRRAERSGAQQCLRLYRLPRHPGQDSCGDRIRTLRHRLLLRPVGQSEPLCDNLQGIERNMGQVMDIFEDLVANAQGDEEILANYKADLLKNVQTTN